MPRCYDVRMPPAQAAAPRWLKEAVAPAVVALCTLAAFLPTLWNGFVGWDDDTLLLGNTDYRGLGPARIAWLAGG